MAFIDNEKFHEINKMFRDMLEAFAERKGLGHGEMYCLLTMEVGSMIAADRPEIVEP